MNNKFIITTTNGVEYGEIVRYIDVVNVNIVIGTNIISDIIASFSDFFGGNSNTYQNKMNDMYYQAMNEMVAKARKIGANSIIGLRIDFDEISGKDKSMFMMSALGTACVVEYKDRHVFDNRNNRSEVSKKDLSKEIARREAVRSVLKDGRVEREFVEYLCENPQDEIFEILFRMFMDSTDTNIEPAASERRVSLRILSNYPQRKLAAYIRDVYLKNNGVSDNIVTLMQRCQLFDADVIYEIMQKDLSIGISLLQIEKDVYTKNDVAAMDRLKCYIDSLQHGKERAELAKMGLFGREREIYEFKEKIEALRNLIGDDEN